MTARSSSIARKNNAVRPTDATRLIAPAWKNTADDSISPMNARHMVPNIIL